jgi:pyridoxal phosphate enzyme (YggS family)
MIGTLQHRKVKDAVTLFDIIESIDSVQLAQRLESRLAITSRRMPILIEMNVGGEPSKHGFSMDSRRTFVRAFEQIATLPHLEVRGLMTIAPMLSDPEDARPFFRTMRELSSHLRDNFPDQTLEHLSMGMTDDFEVAIDEGATIVRIGRAIFGKRI